MNLFWILYVTLRLISDSNQLYKSLRSQFPSVIEVFDLFYTSKIDCRNAERRIFQLFRVADKDWKNHNPVDTCLTIDYLKRSFWVPPPHDTTDCQVFEWRYEESWCCGNCQLVEHRKDKMNVFIVVPEYFRNTVNESVRTLVQESIGNIVCSQCKNQLLPVRRTVSHPMILHLNYVTGVHPQPNLPDHLEKEVELDSKKYDILGATYYGGSRFQFRYFLSPGVFDSRKEILADYREAFAGSFVDDGVRYQIYDVYYRQRSDEYEDESNGLKR